MLNKRTTLGLWICISLCFVTACGGNAAPTATVVPLPSLTGTALPAPTAIPVATTAPTVQVADPADIETTGAFFALSVADLDATAEWYSDKLGLEVALEPPKAGKTTVKVLEGGGLIVELIQNDDARAMSDVAPDIQDKMLVHGIVKAGIIVNDFDRTLARLRERNVPFLIGPFPATADQRANVIVQDNEGNLIQFFGTR